MALFDAMQTRDGLAGGVPVYPFTLRVPSVKEELDERQFYWDANLPRPDWRPGDRILLRSHERLAVSWEKAGADMPLEG